MKRVLASAIFVVAAAGAQAADMAVRAPVYKAPAMASPAYNWTGFYLGGNAGYGWSSSDLGIVPPNGIFGQNFPTTQAGIVANQIANLKPAGFTGGAQAGYNWQASNWLVGLEADASYMGLRKSFGYPLTPLPPAAVSISSAGQLSTDYLITLRPRVGIVFDRFLVYATGGLALTTVNFNQTINVFNTGFGNGSFAGSQSSLRAGWTVGGGAEWALPTSNWRVKAEYLYADFGKFDTVLAFGGFTNPFPAVNGSAFTINSSLRTSIARVGLNHAFGSPVVAKY